MQDCLLCANGLVLYLKEDKVSRVVYSHLMLVIFQILSWEYLLTIQFFVLLCVIPYFWKWHEQVSCLYLKNTDDFLKWQKCHVTLKVYLQAPVLVVSNPFISLAEYKSFFVCDLRERGKLMFVFFPGFLAPLSGFSGMGFQELWNLCNTDSTELVTQLLCFIAHL